MSSFIVVLFVAVLPLFGALVCIVFPLINGAFLRASDRALGVVCPAPEAVAAAPAPTPAMPPRRALRPSRPEPARIARPVGRIWRAA